MPHFITCPVCERQFTPHRPAQIHCSRQCNGVTKMHHFADRFWQRVQKTDTCWLWMGGRNEGGYGRMSYQGRMELAHRVSWIVHFGDIPDNLFVLHRCDNPPCCNPNHLFLGDHTANARDMASKGRQVFQRHPERAARGSRNGNATHPENIRQGERHHKAKLTEHDVLQIRALKEKGQTMSSLALQFGVTEGTIKVIVYRKGWKHI